MTNQWKVVAIATTAWLTMSSEPVSAQFRPDRPDFFEQGQRQLEEEIQRLEQQQPDTTPTLTVESSQTQWSPVLVREGGFAVWMPRGVVAQNTRTVETSNGEIDFQVLSSTASLGRFVVAFSEDLDVSPDDPQAVLERVQDRISGWQTGFGLQGERDVSVEGNPGKDFTLTNSEETIFFRVVLMNERLYVLAVSQSNELASVETKTAFFNSFQQL